MHFKTTVKSLIDHLQIKQLKTQIQIQMQKYKHKQQFEKRKLINAHAIKQLRPLVAAPDPQVGFYLLNPPWVTAFLCFYWLPCFYLKRSYIIAPGTCTLKKKIDCRLP